MDLDVAPKALDFRIPQNLGELSRFLGCTEDQLRYFSAAENKENFFPRMQIPKKNPKRNGDVREVWVIPEEFKDFFKSFARRFDLFARNFGGRYPHSHAYGYIRGRNTLENASQHCGSKFALKADIENFFPSIRESRLRKLFLSMEIKETTSDIISKFCSAEGSLPLGFPASPMLANLVCLDIDDEMVKLAKNYNCVYTRYADDITISGNISVPKKEEIEAIIETEGFALSGKKFRITRHGQSHYVTGLSISSPDRPHIPRTMKRRLRQELYFCKKFGVKNHIHRVCGSRSSVTVQNQINRLEGTVNYVSHIERESWPSLRSDWLALGVRSSFESYANDLDVPRNFTFLIDESECKINNKNYLLLAIVQTEDIELIVATTNGLLRTNLADPFASARKSALERKGLHFTDSDEDLRRDYIDKLITLPFRCYLSFMELTDSSKYESTYKIFLQKLLPHRLMGCDAASVSVEIEENSRIKESELKKLIVGIGKNLRDANNRCPSSLDVKFLGKKDQTAFSVPDYMLGVFSDYLQSCLEKNNQPRKKLLFESLRDKYRVILDASTNIPYTRKRPFIPEAEKFG
jgi:RNA-directed DNA polymerase